MSGYRKFGLKAEDLIMEEIPGVKEALRRMPDEYHDERFFRLKRGMNASGKQTPLPEELHITPADDTQPLVEMIKLVRKEDDEKHAYNSGTVTKQ